MSFRGNEVTVGIRFPKSTDCHVAALLAMTVKSIGWRVILSGSEGSPG